MRGVSFSEESEILSIHQAQLKSHEQLQPMNRVSFTFSCLSQSKVIPADCIDKFLYKLQVRFFFPLINYALVKLFIFKNSDKFANTPSFFYNLTQSIISASSSLQSLRQDSLWPSYPEKTKSKCEGLINFHSLFHYQ